MAIILVTIMFQSPRSGQICSNIATAAVEKYKADLFQSPRSGQICSNAGQVESLDMDRGDCFNPLDRVKFVQIAGEDPTINHFEEVLFQSPRSGQICSNLARDTI